MFMVFPHHLIVNNDFLLCDSDYYPEDPLEEGHG